jgi:hypothetical protein
MTVVMVKSMLITKLPTRKNLLGSVDRHHSLIFLTGGSSADPEFPWSAAASPRIVGVKRVEHLFSRQ